jgi:hypothetical protein
MATPFSVELTMREAPAEAQSRAATALDEPARALGLRLTQRTAGELGFKPRVQFPFLVMLYHTLSGEQVKARFESGPAGGTRVTISGAVARGNHALAADPDYWAEALGATAPATS